MTPTARLTDELMIFMFEVEALQIQSLGNNDTDVDDSAFDITQLDCSALAADAEKAFVKILNAEYNLEKYSNYPRGIDGLFGIGLARYSFVINECYTFETTTASIKGAKFYDFNVSDQPDLVFIEGERVALVKAT